MGQGVLIGIWRCNMKLGAWAWFWKPNGIALARGCSKEVHGASGIHVWA